MAKRVSSGVRFQDVDGEALPPLTDHDLEGAMRALAGEVQLWEEGSFAMVRAVQEAPRNHGKVDAMTSARHGGRLVAVKRMPNWWITESHEEFDKQYPKEVECPWHDLGLAVELRQRGFPHACELLGIFRDSTLTYAVSELATHGDLFCWSMEAPEPGPAREELVRPVASKLCAAIRWLHDLGVAHCDLSLENVLLVGAPGEEGGFQLKIIDFAMASLGRLQDAAHRKQAGKKFYAAPELHDAVSPEQENALFDVFLADGFSLGVLLFSLALADYPWSSTQKGESNNFEFARRFGANTFLQRRALRGVALTSILSRGLLRLLGGLLDVEPDRRLTVGEACYPDIRASVWLYLEDLEVGPEAKACEAGSSSSVFAPCRVVKCQSSVSVSTHMSEGCTPPSDSEAEFA